MLAHGQHGNVHHFVKPQARYNGGINEIREAVEKVFGVGRGFVTEALSHGYGIIEDINAHRRPSAIKSLMFRPPNVTPLRNSRMLAAAQC
jgi:hypothetical protein